MKEVNKVKELRKKKEAKSNKNKKRDHLNSYFPNWENAEATDKNNDIFVKHMQLQLIQNFDLSIQNIHIKEEITYFHTSMIEI